MNFPCLLEKSVIFSAIVMQKMEYVVNIWYVSIIVSLRSAIYLLICFVLV